MVEVVKAVVNAVAILVGVVRVEAVRHFPDVGHAVAIGIDDLRPGKRVLHSKGNARTEDAGVLDAVEVAVGHRTRAVFDRFAAVTADEGAGQRKVLERTDRTVSRTMTRWENWSPTG